MREYIILENFNMDKYICDKSSKPYCLNFLAPEHYMAAYPKWKKTVLSHLSKKRKNAKFMKDTKTEYGYIKGLYAGGSEEQDIYILGVTKPVKQFTGKIIAIIYKLDDVEDKWAAAPENTHFTKKDIRKQTWFQEKYFNSFILVQ